MNTHLNLLTFYFIKPINFEPKNASFWVGPKLSCAPKIFGPSNVRVLKSESTLIMDDAIGIIPSCTLEKALLIAKKFLFCYAIFIGFNSVFWMIFSCCKSHTRKQG